MFNIYLCIFHYDTVRVYYADFTAPIISVSKLLRFGMKARDRR